RFLPTGPTALLATARTLLAARLVAAAIATVAATVLAGTLTRSRSARRRRAFAARGGSRRRGGITAAEQAGEPGKESALGSRHPRCRHGGGRDLRRSRRRLRLLHRHFLADRCRLAGPHRGHRRSGRDIEVGAGQRVHFLLACGGAAIARLAALLLVQLVLADAADLVVRNLELGIGHDH